jgi:hypothetical protein
MKYQLHIMLSSQSLYSLYQPEFKLKLKILLILTKFYPPRSGQTLSKSLQFSFRAKLLFRVISGLFFSFKQVCKFSSLLLAAAIF